MWPGVSYNLPPLAIERVDWSSTPTTTSEVTPDMRQRPTSHDKKLISAIKSRLSRLAAKIGTSTRKRAKVPYSRRATCQSKLNIHLLSIQRPKKMVRERNTSLARVMADLHIPFLPTMRRQRSDTEVLRKLRCLINIPVTLQETRWENWQTLHGREFFSKMCENTDGLNWSLLPTRSPSEAVQKRTFHMDDVWRDSPSLQIPSYWPVFSSVDWEEKPFFELAITDSSENCSRPPPDRWNESSYDEFATSSIHCITKTVHDTRTRGTLGLLQSMHPEIFHWKPQTKERAQRREARRHAGLVDRNQRSLNQDLWPQVAISAFLSQDNDIPSIHSDLICPVYLSETDRAIDVGRLITNIVATDAFPCERRQCILWPPHLSLGTQAPVIDYICLAKHSPLGRDKPVYPLLFAAQCQTDELMRDAAVNRLVIALQPMITLFILYYLDTRKHQDEPMPAWMFLFGAVYDWTGWSLWVFYPSFRPPMPLDKRDDWGWGMDVYRMNFRGTLDEEAGLRGPSVEALYRIQGHCAHVLERLLCWAGYERACSRLSVGK